jgi:hypothetical protein
MYQIEITNRFVASDNLSYGENINRVGRTLKRISKPQLKKVWVCTN